MADSVNLTALTTNLGAYCQENNDLLFQDALLGMGDLLNGQGITLMDGVKDEEPLVNLEVGSVIKPGGDFETFAPTNNVVEFDNRKLKIYPVKADLRIHPQKFEKTYLQHVANGRRTIKDWTDVPFHEYIMQRILKRAQRDLRKATMRGVLNPSGTGFLDICDGFVTKMKADVVAGNIPTVPLGAITTANVIEKLEQMAMEATEAYREVQLYMHVPSKVFDMYMTADPTTVGRWMSFQEAPGAGDVRTARSIRLRIANIMLVENIDLVHAPAASEIFMTPDGNLFCGTHSYSETNAFDFEKNHRAIDMMMDFSWGVEYALANSTNKPIICSDAFEA